MTTTGEECGASVLFVAGFTGSGKTTLCHNLRKIGFTWISAADCLRTLYVSIHRNLPTRLALADFGCRLRSEGQLHQFHAEITRKMRGKAACTIDGLRFKESIVALSKVAACSRLIFLNCPEDLRRARSLDDITFSELERHETELSVADIQSRADLLIDASAPTDTVFNQARMAIETWRLNKV